MLYELSYLFAWACRSESVCVREGWDATLCISVFRTMDYCKASITNVLYRDDIIDVMCGNCNLDTGSAFQRPTQFDGLNKFLTKDGCGFIVLKLLKLAQTKCSNEFHVLCKYRTSCRADIHTNQRELGTSERFFVCVSSIQYQVPTSVSGVA